jgi:hypothetical protein
MTFPPVINFCERPGGRMERGQVRTWVGRVEVASWRQDVIWVGLDGFFPGVGLEVEDMHLGDHRAFGNEPASLCDISPFSWTAVCRGRILHSRTDTSWSRRRSLTHPICTLPSDLGRPVMRSAGAHHKTGRHMAGRALAGGGEVGDRVHFWPVSAVCAWRGAAGPHASWRRGGGGGGGNGARRRGRARGDRRTDARHGALSQKASRLWSTTSAAASRTSRAFRRRRRESRDRAWACETEREQTGIRRLETKAESYIAASLAHCPPPSPIISPGLRSLPSAPRPHIHCM